MCVCVCVCRAGDGLPRPRRREHTRLTETSLGGARQNRGTTPTGGLSPHSRAGSPPPALGTHRAAEGLATREAPRGAPAVRLTQPPPPTPRVTPACRSLELRLRRPTAPRAAWPVPTAGPSPVSQGCAQQEMLSEALTRTLEDPQQRPFLRSPAHPPGAATQRTLRGQERRH